MEKIDVTLHPHQDALTEIADICKIALEGHRVLTEGETIVVFTLANHYKPKPPIPVNIRDLLFGKD